jgi:hypothetical protein
MRWISRAVGGWNVRMTLGGRRRSKFFADAAYVTKAAALRAARAYRDDLVNLRACLPRPIPRPILVTRGKTKCYQIRLPKPGGGTTTTEFSTRVHGVHEARQLALDAYRAAVVRQAGLQPAGPAPAGPVTRNPVRAPAAATGNPKKPSSEPARRKLANPDDP